MSRKNFEKKQKKYLEVEKKRKELLKILFKKGMLIPGSYTETYIRCGNKNCHCQLQGGHYATRISIWEGKKLKTKIVNVADREWVKKASDLYKENKKALREIIKLQMTEKELLKAVIALKNEKYK